MPTQLRILTFNIWGIFVASDIKARMQHLADCISSFDIICLQEQFDEDDFRIVTSKCHDTHPYYLRFPSSFVGSGLAIISRYRITQTHFEQFYVQGLPEKVYHGDYFCNKGVAFCRIKLPDLLGPAEEQPSTEHRKGGEGNEEDLGVFEEEPIDENAEYVVVYNTHLVAQYEAYSRIGGYEKETYAPARQSQALQMAKFIAATARHTDHVVICGDMNSGPDSPEMKIMQAYLRQGSELNVLPALVNDGSNVTYSDANRYNSSASSYFALLDMREDRPQQLDHIFFSSHQLQLIKAEVCFQDNDAVKLTSGGRTPLSDHYGVAAYFVMHEAGTPRTGNPDNRDSPRHYSPLLQKVTAQEGTKAIRYTAKFLSDASHRLLRQAKWLQWATGLLAIALPFLFLFLGGGMARLLDVFCGVVIGFASGICFVLGFTHRRNDAIVMQNQSLELKKMTQ